MSQRPGWRLEGTGRSGECVLERPLFCMELTRPGVPKDPKGSFNGLLRIKVKLPRTKKSCKEVEVGVQLRPRSGSGER